MYRMKAAAVPLHGPLRMPTDQVHRQPAMILERHLCSEQQLSMVF